MFPCSPGRFVALGLFIDPLLSVIPSRFAGATFASRVFVRDEEYPGAQFAPGVLILDFQYHSINDPNLFHA